MINTVNFKTKTVLSERQNPIKKTWNIGLDLGYSAVKGFSPNMVFRFPAFAKKISEDFVSIGAPKDSDIQYKDLNTGEIWSVGESALDLAGLNDSELFVYGRLRYYSPMFQVTTRVGMALGMLSNKYGNPEGKPLFIETGLPPEYRKNDENILIESLVGKYDFAIKIGKNNWIEFHYVLTDKQIHVMDQPMGTLFSISTLSNGKVAPEAAKYFNSNLLIADAGFKTLDIYNLSSGKIITKPETIDNLGMKEIFKRTCEEIQIKYRKEITVTELQRYLGTGKIKILKRNLGSKPISIEEDFSDILEKQCKKICSEALNRICDIYNSLVEHDYLVITGGTCSAWSSYIRDYFEEMQTLKILSGAQNDNLSAVFANVRGYYMYALQNHE